MFANKLFRIRISIKLLLGSKNNLPVQRNAANARERARMRVLSSAFCRLKTKLPWVPADTKLSKLDTLRLATIYIQQLRTSLTTGKDSYPPPYEGSRIESSPSSNSSQTSMVSNLDSNLLLFLAIQLNL